MQLRLRARLENVATVTLPAAYVYAFKIRCTSCRETHDKWVEVNREVTGRARTKGQGWDKNGQEKERRTRDRARREEAPHENPGLRTEGWARRVGAVRLGS